MSKNPTIKEATGYLGNWLQFWRGQLGYAKSERTVRESTYKPRKTAGNVRKLKKSRATAQPSRPLVEINRPVSSYTPFEKDTTKPIRTPQEIRSENKKDGKTRKEIKQLVEPEVVYEGIPKDYIESPQERISKIEKKKAKAKLRLFQPQRVSSKRKQLLYLNVGTEKIRLLTKALKHGYERPKWARSFHTHFHLKGNQLMFE